MSETLEPLSRQQVIDRLAQVERELESMRDVRCGTVKLPLMIERTRLQKRLDEIESLSKS